MTAQAKLFSTRLELRISELVKRYVRRRERFRATEDYNDLVVSWRLKRKIEAARAKLWVKRRNKRDKKRASP